MKRLNLGIIGHGFVGKAVDFGFDTDNVSKYIVDPIIGWTIDDMFKHFVPDVIFVSVPTPMNDNGTIDDSIIVSVFEEIAAKGKDSLVVVKSTVTPDVITKLSKIYTRTVYNPEFLTERNAEHDFVNAEFLIIGGSLLDASYLDSLYSNYSKCKPAPVYYTDLQSASMIKYALNCFLASKVLFFNQLKSVYDHSGTSLPWDDFIHVIKADPRIGESHMSVPGPDGRYGFGGACFKKDSEAMIKYARGLGVPFTMLEEVASANQNIRKKYPELDPREIAQNVNFNVSLKD